MEKLNVIFRAERSGPYRGEITAVFPSIPSDYHGGTLCYAHVGQHGGCNEAWLRNTRPATLDEYGPLLSELRGIYESGDDAVELVVRTRRTPSDYTAYVKEARRLSVA